MKPFRFKKFEVHHDNCCMKVNTDGVLLGAWVNIQKDDSVLDIGTGSGGDCFDDCTESCFENRCS